MKQPWDDRDDRCGTCRFYVTTGGRGQTDLTKFGMGLCHFLPPLIPYFGNSSYSQGGARFPQVDARDWCGQWREEEKPNERLDA